MRNRGFTLIEMLVVIGIIGILVAATLAGVSSVSRAAQRARAADLTQQVAQALSAMYADKDGQWPKRIAMVGERGGRLNDIAAYPFVGGDRQYLSLDHSGGHLCGYDRFGVLDPWGLEIAKRSGNAVTLKAVENHLLWFAVDVDGDGIISGANVGGESLNVRATAIVWGAGADGKMEPYSKGLKKDDVYSWTVGQTRDVK